MPEFPGCFFDDDDLWINARRARAGELARLQLAYFRLDAYMDLFFRLIDEFSSVSDDFSQSLVAVREVFTCGKEYESRVKLTEIFSQALASAQELWRGLCTQQSVDPLDSEEVARMCVTRTLLWCREDEREALSNSSQRS